jgi:hypothetical protein
MPFSVALSGGDLLRIVERIDKLAPAGAGAAHLQDGVFLDLDEMRHIGGLGVEAAGWQDFQLGTVKRFSVAGCVHTRHDGDLAGIWMRVWRDLEALREFEAQGVGARS